MNKIRIELFDMFLLHRIDVLLLVLLVLLYIHFIQLLIHILKLLLHSSTIIIEMILCINSLLHDPLSHIHIILMLYIIQLLLFSWINTLLITIWTYMNVVIDHDCWEFFFTMLTFRWSLRTLLSHMWIVIIKVNLILTKLTVYHTHITISFITLQCRKLLVILSLLNYIIIGLHYIFVLYLIQIYNNNIRSKYFFNSQNSYQ